MVPQAAEVERAVLACMMLDNSLITRGVDCLTAEHFSETRNKTIYGAVMDLYDDSGEVGELSLWTWLDQSGALEQVGGMAYVSALSLDLPDTSGFDRYADVLEERRLRRCMMAMAHDLSRAAQDTSADSRLILAQQQAAVNDIDAVTKADGLLPMADALDETRETISQPQGTAQGISTGLSDLDRVVLGWEPGQLIYLAARPGMGKSILGLQFGMSAAKEGKRVGVFSLEMTRRELSHRIVASESGVMHSRIRANSLHGPERENCYRAISDLALVPLSIDDTADVSVAQMAARATRLQRDHGLDMLIVDYVQLINPGQRYSSENESMTAISRALKILAKRLNIPVIALSQLSRSVERRSPAMPMLSDLRASGSLEQDADAVLFIYRPAYYDSAADDRADLIVAKQRAGRSGVIKLHFDGPRMRFTLDQNERRF